MRVLIPLHSFLPESRFGAELYTYYLARRLQEEGCEVHLFFSRSDGPHSGTYEGLNYTAVSRDRSPATRLGGINITVERKFDALLREFRPDVVHFNHVLNLSPRLPVQAKASGAAVVFTLHDYWLACPSVKLFDRWGDRCAGGNPWKCASCCRFRYSSLTWPPPGECATEGRALKRWGKEAIFQILERPMAALRLRKRDVLLRATVTAVDRFVAPVQFLKRQLVAWGVPETKVIVCDYGTELLPYPGRRPASEPRRMLFGFLGGTTAIKGLPVLLEAFRGFSEADLVIFGPRSTTIEKQFSTVARQPNVRWAGQIDDAQKSEQLPQLDALVVPSIWFENSPLVIHEAFAAGVPVICSGVGGMAELVADGVDGLYFDAGNAASLRQGLLRCTREPALLEKLREGIHKPKSMEFHVREEILSLYCELRNGHSTDAHSTERRPDASFAN